MQKLTRGAESGGNQGRILAVGLQSRGRLTDVVRTAAAWAVVGAAIKVHRALGPGRLESCYQSCLAFEFLQRGVQFRTQVALPVQYDGHRLDCGYRLDFVVSAALILEVKSVDRVLPVHHAQVLTYLKLSGLPQALLLNFNVAWMRHGIRSFLRTDGGVVEQHSTITVEDEETATRSLERFDHSLAPDADT